MNLFLNDILKLILSILTVFIIGCSSNKQLLEQSVKHYKADGGAYLLYDTQRDKITDKQTVNFNLQQEYQPDFAKIGINEQISAEQLLQKYVEKVKNNANVRDFLRQNVLSGEAKKVNIQDVEIFGLATTTSKGQEKEVITTFLGHFVANEKIYGLLVVMDNPQPLKETYGFRSAGWNAVNLARELITALTSKKY
ncbi:MAG: hypothetical protein IJ532_01860 [Alphaproteobacteria bacterium]|nr:hypothetical protein [Alphaproteobacteria bacterium]